MRITGESMTDNFKFIVPAELEKSSDGEWRVKGLASTQGIDQQGEIILQKGLDLSPIENKKGIINFDHMKGPENMIGVLDGYSHGANGLYVEGRLFKNHTKAKAVKEIMDSLGESDRGRMGMSVEGKVLERDPLNPKIIRKCRISAVALTMNPVNSDTYVDMIKSLNASNVEFNTEEETQNAPVAPSTEATFTATQVVTMIQKALSVGSAQATSVPSDLSGGDALAKEDLDSKKKKKVKKMDKEMYKSNIFNILDKLQVLYPTLSRSQLWDSVKDRLNTRFDLTKTNS